MLWRLKPNAPYAMVVAADSMKVVGFGGDDAMVVAVGMRCGGRWRCRLIRGDDDGFVMGGWREGDEDDDMVVGRKIGGGRNYFRWRRRKWREERKMRWGLEGEDPPRNNIPIIKFNKWEELAEELMR
ncbi:hypothetical protein Tco_0414134 [Tanacetum coccineum]